MTERVDIANIALSLLGEQPISSFDDDSSNAKQLTIHYIPARDATLEAHDWSFAIERHILAPLTEKPLYGAGNAFLVPNNILRVIACDDPGTNTVFNPHSTPRINSREQIDWVLEKGNILADEEVVHMRGIRRIEDEGSFSSLFVQLLAAYLASLLAVNLTASDSIATRIESWYEKLDKKAASRDGLQGRSRRIRSRRSSKAR